MWQNFFNAVEKINGSINSVVWGIPMLVLIISTGIYLTVRTGFFQVVRAKFVSNETFLAIFKRKSVRKTKDKKAITQFQALSTALAATIGTGNIAGVATAIAVGGPGAVFWMWISAFFGMMTNYSENVLGIYYRRKNENKEWSGGAMYYLEDGLKKRGMKHIGKILAVLFSIFCVFASFGIGNMTQINSIASAMKSSFNIPAIITGIALAILAGLVIVGGIKRIGRVTEKLVPFMAAFYIIGAVAIFIMNYKQIPYIFTSIFKNAFSFSPIAGAASGLIIKKAVTMGFKRGVFSNEAGLGSSVMVHSASDVKEPVVQGMWGIFEVFFDTIVVCTLTAFVLLSSTCASVSLEDAVGNLTREPQYVSIHNLEQYKSGDEVNLMDTNANPVIEFSDNEDDEIEAEYEVSPDGGKPFTLKVIKDDDSDDSNYVYTNVMTIRGAALDENGKEISDTTAPINTAIVEQVEGVPLVTYAFSQKFGKLSGMLLAIAILLFAFSTVLGWSFYGTKAMEYLFGTKSTIVYKVIFVLFVVVGATMNLSLAWDISDTLNGLMAVPNLIGVLILSNEVVKITKNYTLRKITKKNQDLEPMLSVFEDIQKEQAEAIKNE